MHVNPVMTGNEFFPTVSMSYKRAGGLEVATLYNEPWSSIPFSGLNLYFKLSKSNASRRPAPRSVISTKGYVTEIIIQEEKEKRKAMTPPHRDMTPKFGVFFSQAGLN
jgi:hypothetical protein